MLGLLKKRRSIRYFKQETISSEIETKLVEAAKLVPSPTNSQPLRIKSFHSKKSRDELLENMQLGKELIIKKAEKLENKQLLKKIKFYWRFSLPIFDAPLLWAVYGKPSSLINLPKNIEKIMNLDFSRQSGVDISLGCSIQNACLQAVELGLGSCIYTAPVKFLSASKQTEIPTAFVTFGIPDESPKEPKRKDVDVWQIV